MVRHPRRLRCTRFSRHRGRGLVYPHVHEFAEWLEPVHENEYLLHELHQMRNQ